MSSTNLSGRLTQTDQPAATSRFPLGGGNDDEPRNYDGSYALSGRIMLSAIVILFFVVILMVCLHLYARWYLLRARRRNYRGRRGGGGRGSGRGNLVFHVGAATSPASRGLDAAVLNSLPVFVFSYDKTAGQAPIECAVCLSEFEDGEAGRRLPKCGHSFHTECIDMWFHSHATCPLCRSAVEPGSEPEIRLDVIAAASAEPEGTEPISGPVSSGLCAECECEASSSVESRRKPFASVSIDVPRRNFENFGESVGSDSPASQTTSFKSPMSRMLSFKRILSREKRNGGGSPSGNSNHNAASCSSVNELEIEKGKEATQ